MENSWNWMKLIWNNMEIEYIESQHYMSLVKYISME